MTSEFLVYTFNPKLRARLIFYFKNDKNTSKIYSTIALSRYIFRFLKVEFKNQLYFKGKYNLTKIQK
jgi:hypothetical protein